MRPGDAVNRSSGGPCDNPGMRRAAVAVALVAAAVGIVALGGRALRDRARRPTSLLLVSIDTLRADHLGSYGYAAAQTPRLDALARLGPAVRDRRPPSMPLTLPAHSSLMTGTFPASARRARQRRLLPRRRTDDARRGAAGQGLPDRRLRRAPSCSTRRWGIAQGFDRYFDDFDLDKFEDAASMDADPAPRRRGGGRRPSSGWPRTGERPFFAWVHLYDPHAPYDAPEPFRSRFPATSIGAYDAEIASSDSQVGRLLDALRRRRPARRAPWWWWWATTARSLGEHGEQTHGFFVYDATVHIPHDHGRARRPGTRGGGPGADRRRDADRSAICSECRSRRPCRE